MIYEMIMPISVDDYDYAKINVHFIKRFINPNTIVIIARDCLKKKIIEDFGADNIIKFINEDELFQGMSFDKIKTILSKRGAENRTGWYFQQFLKMAYSYKCDCEYYLSWDTDTIPIKKIEMFSGFQPIFDIKYEYHEPYFNTMNKLLGLNKTIKKSYISEHLMFNKNIMRELIEKIDCISDESWYENILNCISEKDIAHSGFSEFETYGTYVETYYSGMYSYREIDTIRRGKYLFNTIPSNDALNWLAMEYYAISFEKWDYNKIKGTLAECAFIRNIIPPRKYIHWCEKYPQLVKFIEKLL